MKPDISVSVSYLGIFTVNTVAKVCRTVSRICHYPNGTQDYGIIKNQTNYMALSGNDMKLVSAVVA